MRMLRNNSNIGNHLTGEQNVACIENSVEPSFGLPVRELRHARSIQQPLVSVILPTYNNCHFVVEALESVLSQSFGNLEVIVVDDGSTDETLSALKPYRDSIVLIEILNRGPAGARNAGISHATGEFIAFLDSDDLWLPEKIEQQTAYLTAHPDTGVVFCDSEAFGSGRHARCGGRADTWTQSGTTFETLLTHRPIALSSVIVRRSCLDTTGLFDESLIGAEDYNLFLRLSRTFTFGYIDRVMVRKRSHDNNLSDDLSCMHLDEISNLQKIAALFPDDRVPVRNLSGQIHYRFGKYYFDRKDFHNARLCFFYSLLRRPASRLTWAYMAAACLPEWVRGYASGIRKRAKAWLGGGRAGNARS
jgi:glycosyltransferase involved in cell wall biosynthesis